MAFRLLALVASDRSKAEILIAYPVCNIMEETSSVIVCSVNIGNLIISRREVLEACIIEAVPIVFVVRDSSRGGYLGSVLLGMCRWPLRAPAPL